MHIKMGNPEKQVNYKMAAEMTLPRNSTAANGTTPPTGPELLRVENGWLQLVSDNQRRRNGARISYDVLSDGADLGRAVHGRHSGNDSRGMAPLCPTGRATIRSARGCPRGRAFSYAVISFLDAESPLPDEPPEAAGFNA